MAEESEKIKRLRSTIRRVVALRLVEAGDIMKEESPDVVSLLQIKNTLEEKRDTLREMDEEVIKETQSEDDLVTEICTSDKLREDIGAVIHRINRLLAHDSNSTSLVEDSPQSTTLQEQAIQSQLSTQSIDSRDGIQPHKQPESGKVKLPKLELRKFDGDITHWTAFWDSFESAIHSNGSLSDIEKFNYLRSLLEKSAKEAISGLTLSSANYQQAIDVLKRRFGNKERLVSRHMDLLVGLDRVTTDSKVGALRKLYDKIESNIRSLQSLEVRAETYGSLLCPLLMKKFPPELQLTISRRVPTSEWNINNILTVFLEELEARERTEGMGKEENKRMKDMATGATLYTGIRPDQCVYCGLRGHVSTSCKKVSNVDDCKQKLKHSGRCYICLKKGHTAGTCKSNLRCVKCRERHHASICYKSSDKSKPLNPKAPTFQADQTTTLFTGHSHQAILLQTAVGYVANPKEPGLKATAQIILDSGSQRSYVTLKLSKYLKLKPTGKRSVTILTFGSEKGTSQDCDVVKIDLLIPDGSQITLKLLVVPFICEPIVRPSLRECLAHYPHLGQLQLADPVVTEHFTPDILIGSDFYWSLMTGEVMVSATGPVAMNGKLGWVISGPSSCDRESDRASTLVTHTLRVGAEVGTKKLDKALQRFWDLESIGIIDDEKQVFDQFRDHISFMGDRYEVSLPWKDPLRDIPSNYNLSLKRLTSLLKRLKQDPLTFEAYHKVIQEQVDNGMVEKVDNPEVIQGDRVHYLPHHAVIRIDKETTKLRVVYDASAKQHGPSLNDCLLPGPKLQQEIFNILLTFRAHRVADIEKAFLNIAVAPRDRDVLRFLWISSLDDPSEIAVFRFTRVMFGVNCSPFLLNATVRTHLEQFVDEYAEVVPKLMNAIYVDDVVSGAHTEEAAEEIFYTAKQLLSKAGFNLRKFISNSEVLQQKFGLLEEIAKKDNAESYAKLAISKTVEPEKGETKVLGVLWDVKKDLFVFRIKILAKEAREIHPTKRQVISVTSKFFDQLGLFSPLIIKFKIFFQKLCVSKVDWDEILKGAELKTWNLLVEGLSQVDTITVPRCYTVGGEESKPRARLYGFCDASINAYAPVVYLVVQSEVASLPTLVTSKTRVAPLHKQTIPRLELLSAVLLSRLVSTVHEIMMRTFDMEQTICYTDSEITMHWIKGHDKAWKPFVQNRVQEIRQRIPSEFWYHCISQENPADIPSRGLAAQELQQCQMWWHGPAWIGKGNNEKWEKEELPEGCKSELCSKERSTVLLTNISEGIGNIISLNAFSRINKLFRLTALVLKAMGKMRRSEATEIGYRRKAEQLWIKEAQKAVVKDRLFQEWKVQFALFEGKDGIWRCRGRLGNSNMTEESKYPILLPRQHHLTQLVIVKAHERVMHNGIRDTLTEVRSQYWIIGGRSLIKKLLHKCKACRVIQSRHLQAPPPPLPSFRVQENPPFVNTGVDYAGPLFVKEKEKDACKQKVWISLFTCCVTRAVHLELVNDLTSHAFIKCFKRFTARRGVPALVVSDNGTTFKGASKILQKIIQRTEVQEHFGEFGIQWIYNVERAPWWGGLFERLVQSTKRCMRKYIGKAKLTHEELMTVTIEVEAVLNSRPLTYITMFQDGEPLTPSHLLTGRRILSLPDHLGYKELANQNYDTEVKRRMEYLDTTLKGFWKKWQMEYLRELRERHRIRTRNSRATPISVGDIIIVHEDNMPRNFWKLGRVEETITGKDGITRAAVVKVHFKDGKTKLLKRPIQRLYPIEIQNSHVTDGSQDSQDSRYQDGSQDSQDSRYQVGSQNTHVTDGSQDSQDSRYQDGSQDSRYQVGSQNSQDSQDSRYQDGSQDSQDSRYQVGSQNSQDSRYQDGSQDSQDSRYQDGSQDSQDSRYQDGSQDGSQDSRYQVGSQNSHVTDGSQDSQDSRYQDGSQDSQDSRYQDGSQDGSQDSRYQVGSQNSHVTDGSQDSQDSRYQDGSQDSQDSRYQDGSQDGSQDSRYQVGSQNSHVTDGSQDSQDSRYQVGSQNTHVTDGSQDSQNSRYQDGSQDSQDSCYQVGSQNSHVTDGSQDSQDSRYQDGSQDSQVRRIQCRPHSRRVAAQRV